MNNVIISINIESNADSGKNYLLGHRRYEYNRVLSFSQCTISKDGLIKYYKNFILGSLKE